MGQKIHRKKKVAIKTEQVLRPTHILQQVLRFSREFKLTRKYQVCKRCINFQPFYAARLIEDYIPQQHSLYYKLPHSRHLINIPIALGTHCTGGWKGYRADLDTVGPEKSLVPVGESNPGPSSPYPAATPAPRTKLCSLKILTYTTISYKTGSYRYTSTHSVCTG
jgi:hypothetical protein